MKILTNFFVNAEYFVNAFFVNANKFRERKLGGELAVSFGDLANPLRPGNAQTGALECAIRAWKTLRGVVGVQIPSRPRPLRREP